MRQAQNAELLEIHISESDRHGGKLLYEAIVEKCRELKMAGATVFRGLEGYGETAEMHRGRSGRPIVVTVVDIEERTGALAAAVAEMMDTGLVVRSQVETVRVRNG